MKSQLKTPKQVKVTAVVTMLKVFGDRINNSRNTNPEKLLNKPDKELNTKKKHLNRSKKHLKGPYEPDSDASKRLIVKQKRKKCPITLISYMSTSVDPPSWCSSPKTSPIITN